MQRIPNEQRQEIFFNFPHSSQYMWHCIYVTFITSRPTRHALYVTPYTSRSIRHALHVTLYTSRPTRHVHYVTPYTSRSIRHGLFEMVSRESLWTIVCVTACLRTSFTAFYWNEFIVVITFTASSVINYVFDIYCDNTCI